MLLSCRDAVDPSTEADERRGGPVDVPDPVQQATPAPQRPRVGQMPDRLLHQGAQPGLEAVVVAFGRRALVFGASVPERRSGRHVRVRRGACADFRNGSQAGHAIR
jgi:hypothetical protein